MSGVSRAADRPAVEIDRAGAQPPQPHDGAQGRGLAGAVAAEQHGQPPAPHGEIDAVQDVIAADMGVDAGEAQQRRAIGHLASSIAAWTWLLMMSRRRECQGSGTRLLLI